MQLLTDTRLVIFCRSRTTGASCYRPGAETVVKSLPAEESLERGQHVQWQTALYFDIHAASKRVCVSCINAGV